MEVKIPKLTKDDIEVRVKRVTQTNGKVYAILVLYKNARIDMNILDEVFGTFGWMRRHDILEGRLFCTVSVWSQSQQMWINKQDVGFSENDIQSQKTEASDSFKRACVNLGIGRELYTAPHIITTLNSTEYFEKGQGGKITCKATLKFSVGHIAYDEKGRITELVIVDGKNNIRFKYKKGDKRC